MHRLIFALAALALAGCAAPKPLPIVTASPWATACSTHTASCHTATASR